MKRFGQSRLLFFALTFLAALVLSLVKGCAPCQATPTAAPALTPPLAPTIQPPNYPTTQPSNAPTTAPSPTAARVPTEFRALYNELDSALTAFDQSFDASDTPYPVTFAAELLPANGNRGTELFNPTNLQATRIWLDRLQAIGVQNVTIAIKFPLLTPDFPNSAKYLE